MFRTARTPLYNTSRTALCECISPGETQEISHVEGGLSWRAVRTGGFTLLAGVPSRLWIWVTSAPSMIAARCQGRLCRSRDGCCCFTRAGRAAAAYLFTFTSAWPSCETGAGPFDASAGRRVSDAIFTTRSSQARPGSWSKEIASGCGIRRRRNGECQAKKAEPRRISTQSSMPAAQMPSIGRPPTSYVWNTTRMSTPSPGRSSSPSVDAIG